MFQEDYPASRALTVLLSEKDLLNCQHSFDYSNLTFETDQPPTLTKIDKSCFTDLTFVMSENKLEGVEVSIVTIWYEPGSM